METIRTNKTLTDEIITKVVSLLKDNDYIFMCRIKDNTQEENFWKETDPDYYESIKHTFQNYLEGYIVSAKYFINTGYINDYCDLMQIMYDTKIDFGETYEAYIELYSDFNETVSTLKEKGVNVFSPDTFNEFLKQNNIPYVLEDFWFDHDTKYGSDVEIDDQPVEMNDSFDDLIKQFMEV